VIAFSKRGCVLAQEVRRALPGHECALYSKTSAGSPGTERVEGALSEWTRESFASSDAMVFIGAAGIAVREAAPFLRNKAVDPAVICMDEGGRFVVPLLSGHIGGANALAVEIAAGVGATPVVTTATDVLGRFSVDAFAARNGLHIGSMAAAKEVSARIVDGGRVGLASDVPLAGVPPELDICAGGDIGIYISHGRSQGPFERTLKLTPRRHVLGIGCRRGTPCGRIEALVACVLEREDISPLSVRAVASIDLKRGEEGLLEFARAAGAATAFFSAEELASLPDIGFTPSERVKAVTGVDNVCERAAVAASAGGELVVRKTAADGVTVAVAREPVRLDLTEG